MKDIKAIGFDLFNTLITAQPQALLEAQQRLIASLRTGGLTLDTEAFQQAYKEAAVSFIEEAHRSGRETHNRFWISAALKTQGYDIDPDDRRIATAVETYFSVFPAYCRAIPQTEKMLQSLRGRYKLGLLSNFTHPPAAMQIMQSVGLLPFFDVVLISGALGYRKPHPLVFRRLLGQLGVAAEQVVFVGDDVEADIQGAASAGMQPVWAVHVREQNIASAKMMQPGEAREPGAGVPKVASWRQFTELLATD